MTRIRKAPRNPRRSVAMPAPPIGGTISEVVGWVSGDRRRAQAAYDAEAARGTDARSSLLDRLARLGARERSGQ